MLTACPTYELDPATLETRGERNLGGVLQRTFTAHPSSIRETGECIAFGYNAPGHPTRDIELYVVAYTCPKVAMQTHAFNAWEELDALHLDRDPVAVVRFPYRVHEGFHGSWVSARALGW